MNFYLLLLTTGHIKGLFQLTRNAFVDQLEIVRQFISIHYRRAQLFSVQFVAFLKLIHDRLLLSWNEPKIEARLHENRKTTLNSAILKNYIRLSQPDKFID